MTTPPPPSEQLPERDPLDARGVGYWLGFALGFSARWLLRLTLLFFLLLIAAYFLIQLPAVQRYAAKRVATAVSQTFDVEVSIGRIDIEPFTRLRLSDVFIGDRQGDTLVLAGSLGAQFFRPLRSLRDRTLYIEALDLNGARVKLYRDTTAPAGNYDFLEPYFAKQPSTDLVNRDPFQINLTNLDLRDIRVQLRDEFTGNRGELRLELAEVLLHELDLPNKVIRGNSLSVEDLEVELRRRDPTQQAASVDSGGADSAGSADTAKQQSMFGPLALSFEDIEIGGSSLLIDDERTSLSPNSSQSTRKVKVTDITIDLAELVLLPDSLGAQVGGISFDTDLGLTLYEFTAGTLSLTPREFTLAALSLQTSRSRFGDRVRLTLPAGASWAEALDRGRLELDLKPSAVDVSEVLSALPDLRGNPYLAALADGKVQLRGQFRGSIDALRVNDLDVTLPDGTRLSADISTRNLRTPAEAMLNVEVRTLETSMQRVRKLLPGTRIPADFDKLGDIKFTGRFDGFVNDFVAYGDLRTQLGRATLDTRFIAEAGELPRYTGNAALFDFDIGTYTGNRDLGRVSAKLDIREGTGLRPSDLRLDVIGTVANLDFRGYTYRDIALNGTIAPGSYVGALTFADEHADLEFNGAVSLVEGEEQFDFTANIHQLDLLPLRLSEEDYALQGIVDIESNSLDPDNLRGKVTVQSFSVRTPTGATYAADSLIAEQQIAPDGSKRLLLDSPFALINLSGEYRLRTLPNTMQAAFAKTYPELYERTQLGAVVAKDSLATRISLEAKLLAVDSLLETFSVPASNLAGSALALTLDTDRESLDLSLSSAAPSVAGLSLVNLGFDLRGQSGDLDLEAHAERVSLGAFGFSDLTIYSEYADGDTRFAVTADTATSVLGEINFAGALVLEDTAVTFTLDPSSHVDIGGERWTVEPGNELVVGRRKLIARDLQLTAGGRFIEVETVGARGLNVLLRRFNLDLLNAYLNPDKAQVEGEVDAFFTASDIYAREGLNFSASVDTFRVNGVDWGAIQTLATQAKTDEALTLYTTFSRYGQQAVLDAVVALQEGVVLNGEARPKQYVDAHLTSEDFDMSFLGYFIPGITDLVGELSADLTVRGTPTSLVPSGGILVDECALTIDYTRTRYFVDSQFVSIDERILDASGRQIRDQYGNLATITGGLVHDRLLKWGLDVSLRTNRLHVLGTKRDENPLYYGTAFASGRIGFTGPFNQANLDIDAAALAGSSVFFPVAGTSTEDELRFINFRQPDDSTRQEVATFLRGLNVDMDIEVRPAAELFIVFDEAAGDILRGQGTGDIQIDVQRSGSYSMFGEFTVAEGDYLFTLLNVVNKPFSIRPGGTINWDGDPFTAQLNLTAEYKGLSVAPIGLIREYESVLGNTGLADLANQRTRVSLLLELQGDLLRPDLDFEIELPDLQGELRNYVNSKLQLIRADENALNRQVFGLIVVGQFLPEVDQLQPTAVGFNTISELFSNQFSYLLTELFTSLAGTDGALSGIDIDINLQNNSSLAGAGASTGNDLQTQLRTYFFDDRLEVGVGANFGQTAFSNGEGQFTAGQFEVTYALTEDRRLRLRTYASRNVDLRNFNRNRAGVGLTWRRSFDSFAELLGREKESARKEPPIKIFESASRAGG